jgi:hypothetical protein
LLAVYLTRDNIQNTERVQKLNTKKVNNPVNKWANELSEHFSKEVKMPNYM